MNDEQNKYECSNGVLNGTREISDGVVTCDGTLINLDLNVKYKKNYGAHKPGMTVQEVSNYYTGWASNYEKDLCPGVYNGPAITAAEIARLYQTNRDQVRILDVAAGTGLLGTKLSETGFTNLDGLDPSEGMLKISKSKKIYTNLICDYVGKGESNFKSDTYDCVAISGGMGESHIPCGALHELINIVKPGGYVVIVMRLEYLTCVEEYKDRLEQLMNSLEEKGLWKKVVRKIVPCYSFQREGVVFVYQVL